MKLRLGFVNSAGQQKGVDSLIVTDMIELARLKSISGAVLMSGDEDVRVGVQIAQSYGVRVHLVGIAPSRSSQSPQLMQEADTTSEWDRAFIEGIISLRSIAPIGIASTAPAISIKDRLTPMSDPSADLELAVRGFVGALEATDLQGLATYWQTDRGVPSDFDRKLLPACRTAIGRDLDQAEKKAARTHFQRFVTERLPK